MLKWFAFIVLLLICTSALSFAKMRGKTRLYSTGSYRLFPDSAAEIPPDTINIKSLKQKQLEFDNKKKIKEVAKAKRQPKPEKVETTGQTATDAKPKPKRQRRPEGLERPPEIPRRNGS